MPRPNFEKRERREKERKKKGEKERREERERKSSLFFGAADNASSFKVRRRLAGFFLFFLSFFFSFFFFLSFSFFFFLSFFVARPLQQPRSLALRDFFSRLRRMQNCTKIDRIFFSENRLNYDEEKKKEKERKKKERKKERKKGNKFLSSLLSTPPQKMASCKTKTPNANKHLLKPSGPTLVSERETGTRRL